MNNFFKLIALILTCAQADLFAPKGGGICSSSGDCYTGRGDCYSGFGFGECAAPCVGGGGYNAGDNGASGQGGIAEFFGSNSSGGNASRDTISIAGLRGAALEQAAQEVEAQFMAECYMVRDGRTYGKVCTRSEVLAAVKSLEIFAAGVAAQEISEDEAHNMIMGLLNVGVPLDCAVARQVPMEFCQQVAEETQHFETMIRMEQEVEAQKREALTAQIDRIYNNDLHAGKKTEADAKKVLTDAKSQGLSLSTIQQVAVATAQKIKNEIDHEIAERKQILAGPKRISIGTWGKALSIHFGINRLAPDEKRNLERQFGSLKAAARAIEIASKKCVQPENSLHLCYALNDAAMLDAMSPEAEQAHLAQVKKDLDLLRAIGL